MNIYDSVIIGGGPAGLTAGIYCGRAMMKTLLLETYSVPNQVVLTDEIENYPGFPEGINGFDLIEKMKNQVKKFNIEISEGLVTGLKKNGKLWQVKTENSTYETYSVIAGAGAKARELGIPGEKEFRGKGVSYCAVCDGAFFRNKSVAVIGGGDTAVQEAIYLTRYASRVFLLHRRDTLRAQKILQAQAFANKKIEFIWNAVPEKITGSQTVTALVYNKTDRPETMNLALDGVFIFIGFSPNTAFLSGVISCDQDGWAIADQRMQTSEAGIFICGDVRAGSYRQIIIACGDGAAASLSAEHYVSKIKGPAA
ncbi:MAG TPA: thioredoxin-disulfide reductase [Spirochaetia bacterium]|nr:thioredoxin-disulfide reductase [Spirochaetia bacterium]